MSNEIFFRVVHSFAVTLSIQFCTRPDVTVTIDQAAVVECHFILVKVEGVSRLLQGPDNLAIKGASSVGPTKTTPSFRFGSDLSAVGSSLAVRSLNLQMDRLRRST